MDDSADRIAIASDHAGYELKEVIKAHISGRGCEVVDFGPSRDESVDYPDFGAKVAEAVSTGKHRRGILICGTGLGMSIVANKFPGVRAVVCYEPELARLGREHNDSNVLILGGRVTGPELAREIVDVWLDTPFAGGRHQRRIDKITQLERRLMG